MTTTVDLTPAARRMAELIAGVPDDRLRGPTPCPAYTLGDLVEHVGGLALASPPPPPSPAGTRAAPGRRRRPATRPGWATTGASASPGTWPTWPRRGGTRRRGPG